MKKLYATLLVFGALRFAQAGYFGVVLTSAAVTPTTSGYFASCAPTSGAAESTVNASTSTTLDISGQPGQVSASASISMTVTLDVYWKTESAHDAPPANAYFETFKTGSVAWIASTSSNGGSGIPNAGGNGTANGIASSNGTCGSPYSASNSGSDTHSQNGTLALNGFVQIYGPSPDVDVPGLRIWKSAGNQHSLSAAASSYVSTGGMLGYGHYLHGASGCISTASLATHIAWP